MDELVVGKMYYVSAVSLDEAYFNMSRYPKASLCKCTSLRGKFKVREGVYSYMKYWVAEEEAKKMVDKITDAELGDFVEGLEDHYPPRWYIRVLAKNLQDARKELEEVKKDSVWRELPDDVSCATVEYISSNGIAWSVPHKRIIPKTPKQELIDSFAEKNALAMKCSGLNKELLEAFVKEYEEMKK